MMKINGFNGTNTQTGAMGMAQANDSVSKNIQNQIANAQQKLQDLSSNEELSLEDKMKKRQEIQQEITNLNQQLRQHQIEQRKEQQSKKSSMDDMVAGTKNTSAKKGTGLSQAGMRAMISADSSMKQAKVQGSMATQMEGRAGVLESEIKQDAGKGNTEKKEEELADLQAKAQSATAAQMSSLSDANKSMEEGNKLELDEDALKQADISSLKTVFTGYNSFVSKISQKATCISNAANRASATYTNNGTYSKTDSLLTSSKIDEEV